MNDPRHAFDLRTGRDSVRRIDLLSAISLLVLAVTCYIAGRHDGELTQIQRCEAALHQPAH